MMVLWLLILRATGIEFRSHIDSYMWQAFFDVVFSLSSAMLALFFGVALGNVIRGVPLDSTGYFFEPLWTNFKLGPQTGILDWYTLLTGAVALVTLTAHGSYYVALKTDADLSRRARGFALLCWPVQFFLSCSALVATYFIRPEIMDNYAKYKVALLVPAVVFICLGIMLWANPQGKERLAFAASSLFIVAMLVGAAVGLYPIVLPARDRHHDLTIANTAAGSHGLSVGLVWWTLGVVLAIAYFAFVYRKFSGKVRLEEGHY
jgi:cytochrome d ubiquinol oxidase subunit II